MLQTPPGTSEYQLYRDAEADPPALVHVPPLLEHLGLIELEHNPRNNRTRAR